jgi:hypothetical protein
MDVFVPGAAHMSSTRCEHRTSKHSGGSMLTCQHRTWRRQLQASTRRLVMFPDALFVSLRGCKRLLSAPPYGGQLTAS